ncbi:MAG: DUF4093 domain-containing protein [Ruminococcaceae bacterium]|nr:DUF4093 domain-containing protein [Oscillospiraceae bacterium]
MDKLIIPYPVIVEGKYDRETLSRIIDAQIIRTDGFGIFNRGEKLALIRRLAAETPVIVLTDSDGAGKVIRSFIHSALPPEKIIDLYTPAVMGKEKRKKAPSKAGRLGVEGFDAATLRPLFAPYADPEAARRAAENPLSKTDFYLDGLSGGDNSQAKRDTLAAAFALPPGMSAAALLAALRCVCSYAEYKAHVARLFPSAEA